MRYSQLFGKTSKNAPHDADSVNARLLVQGGFVDQLMAGVYTMLPLGLRVLDKITAIIREEMDAIGGQELLMPALQPKEPWEKTGRWTDPGTEVMFQFEGRGGKQIGLGWTHEEIVTPLAGQFIRSYKDLPLAVYQIQSKFRNEPRAKSGVLRGREFLMKDLYSFHRTAEDLEAFYRKAQEAYVRVFERCGLDAIMTEASGGAFSKISHEYQVLTESGEDIVLYCVSCRFAQNREITEMKSGDACPKCGEGKIAEGKAIEVGNIFRLHTRFTDAFNVQFTDEDGARKPVLMGCYGIGPTRVLGTIVEVHNDAKGIVWPRAVAPFDVHVVSLGGKDPKTVTAAAEALVKDIEGCGLDVLWDDRDAGPGEKFADADLIGIPLRLIISEKSLAKDAVEWKERGSEKADLIPQKELVEAVRAWVGFRAA